MTILFVTHYTGLYGANRSMLTLIELLQSKYNVKPIVLVPCGHGHLLDLLREQNIPYYIMPFFNWLSTNMEPKYGRYKCAKRHIKNILRVLEIKKMLRQQQIDIVYSNSVTLHIGALIAFVLRVPHIWHFREAIKAFGMRLTMPRVFAKWIVHLSSNKRYILISDFMLNEYKHLLPQDKLRRIYNGVSLPTGIETRSYNQINGTLHLACVGVLCPQKNQIELLKAIVKLKERHYHIHAHFVGVEALGYMEKMTKFIEEYNIGEMVTIHGHSNNVFSILESCNLGVVAAKDEAFGRVTVEYMLMHMPVIASNSGANSELIDSESTGMIYHYGNAEELADKIQKYIDNPLLLNEHGHNAYLKAINEFSAERNAELIYSEILNIHMENNCCIK